MWLRVLIIGLACFLSAPHVLAAEKPYRVSLTGDAFDGEAWHTGVLVSLDPGWKVEKFVEEIVAVEVNDAG